ncbi:MAG: OpgC domain-containing protein [Candidatus Hodarchaeota archaeon]
MIYSQSSGSYQSSTASNQRHFIIDYFRGIVIIDMIFLHFSQHLTYFLRTLIKFSDIAAEGFIFLAGFMIGEHYLKKFVVNKKQVILRLFLRSVQLLLIHYIMILTISLPFYSYFQLKNWNHILTFLLSSFFFINQIPILHILPTFIPLFLISPLILTMLVYDWDYCLIFLSIMFFLLGCYNPYVFDEGEKTIFPVILWQIYFVLGIIVGKFREDFKNVNNNRLLIYAAIFYSFVFFMKYGGYFNVIHNIKSTYNIYPKKFPLNIYGLLYGVSFLFFLYTVFFPIWTIIKKCHLISNILTLLGRHSLLTFVVHAYFVYLIKTFAALNFNKYIIYFSIILSTYSIYCIISTIDKLLARNKLPTIYKRIFC